MPSTRAAAAHVCLEIDVPSRRAQGGEIGDRRLRARQNDEVDVRGDRLPGTQELRGRRPAPGAAHRSRRSWRRADRPARRRAPSRRGLARGATRGRAHPRPAGDRRRRSTARGRRRASRSSSRTRARPSANSVGSPRNLLTMKPSIMRASSGGSTVFVPTRLAMTPPRSMSPMSTTGTSAARAKPMLAMSPCAQVDLGRRAGALDQDDVRLGAQPRKAVEHGGACSCGFMCWYSAALALPTTRPCTTTCAPISLCGFSSTGFMCTLGRHAGRTRLQRLRAPDLAAVGRHRRVVGHVLRLERPHAQPAVVEQAGKPGHQQSTCRRRSRCPET